MQRSLRPSSVIPPGFTIVASSVADDRATILVRSTSPTSQCPSCSSVSRSIHSRYRRQISDLPLAGRPVKRMADFRRFRCEAVRCGQRIFTERFAAGVLAPWARRTGRLETLVHHLGLVLGGWPAASFARRLVLRGERSDVFRTRETSLEAYLPWLDLQWAAGRHNGAALWRSLQAQGFRGSLRVVNEWATRRRRAEKVDADTLHRVPSARTIARLMTIDRDDLSKAETITVAAVEAGVPSLVDARCIIEGFHVMIRRKAGADLEPWIVRARASLIVSFANGVARDITAVRAAIVSQWSNGQTEGQITKLKLVKRQMYGRGKLDLLQARLIGAP